MNKPKIFVLLSSFLLLWTFALAELNSMHFDPQPQFWTEACVVWGILALSTACLIKSSKITIPFVIVPLTIFAVYIIIQPFIVRNPTLFNGVNYVVGFEMLTCILLAITISTLANEIGYKKLIHILAYVLFFGAMLQSFIGLAQYLGIAHKFDDFIFYDGLHPTTNIFGHFGQRNHYAHYLSWGMFSLIYLYVKRKIPNIAFFPLMFWLCFALTLSASRSVFIYFGLASFIALSALIFNRDNDIKTLAKIIILTTICLFAVEYLYPIIYKIFHQSQGFSSGLSRIEGDQGTGRRTVEWQKAILTFQESPIWGTGWGGFARQSVFLHPFFPNAALNSGLFTNCHNLILQLLAETGIVGAAIFILGFLITAIKLTYKNLSVETIILLCMIGTTISHSMNEYPLWYIYFLAGFVTFLSLDKKPIFVSSSYIFRLVGLSAIVVIGVLLTTNSFKFDRLVEYYDAPDNQQEYQHQISYLEHTTQQDVLMQYYDYFVLDNYINVDTDYTDDYMSVESQYEYTKRFVNYHPYPDTMIKYAMLEYNMNESAQAESMVKLACNAFPVYIKSFKNTLSDPYYSDLLKLVK